MVCSCSALQSSKTGYNTSHCIRFSTETLQIHYPDSEIQQPNLTVGAKISEFENCLNGLKLNDLHQENIEVFLMTEQ